MINLTTFFTSLGITGGNTQATNFYEFWYGIEFSSGTITYNITDFMTHLGTTRYEFFHSLNSEYPDVIDETSFYSNIDDNRIYDFSTFYIYAGEFLRGTPVTPTPTPTPPTPTPTNTPTPTPTNTPTPSPSPTIQATYIGETRSTTNALSYTFTSQSYGGEGYIVVAIASTSTIQQSPSITSVSIAGKAATNLYSAPQTATLSPGFWAVRLTGGTSGDIVVNYSVAQLGCSIAIYRIQNNISDTYNQRTFATLNSGAGTTLTKTFASNVNSNDIVLALAITDNAASTETWTRPTENAARVNETIRSSYASEKQTTTGSYTTTVEFSAEPTTRASLTMITIR